MFAFVFAAANVVAGVASAGTDPADPPLVLKPKAFDAARAATLLHGLFPDLRVRDDERTDSVVVFGPKSRLDAVRTTFEALESKSPHATDAQTFALRFADPGRVVSTLRKLYPSARIVTGPQRTIVALAPASQLTEITAIVQLDVGVGGGITRGPPIVQLRVHRRGIEETARDLGMTCAGAFEPHGDRARGALAFSVRERLIVVRNERVAPASGAGEAHVAVFVCFGQHLAHTAIGELQNCGELGGRRGTFQRVEDAEERPQVGAHEAPSHGWLLVRLCGWRLRHTDKRAVGRIRRNMDRAARDGRILVLLANGHTTKSIARELGASEDAIDGSVREMQLRAGVRNRAHLVAWAFRENLLRAGDVEEAR
jgi:DNA-binding CsgD family transcriptional regulator